MAEPIPVSTVFSAEGLEIRDNIDMSDLEASPFEGTITGPAGTYTFNVDGLREHFNEGDYYNIFMYANESEIAFVNKNVSQSSHTVTGLVFDATYTTVKVVIADEHQTELCECLYETDFS